MGRRSISDFYIYCLHLIFWERFSPWIRISWIQLDWLTLESTERASDFSSKIRLTSVHSHVWHLMWMLGNGVWVIILAHWTAFLAPIIIYIHIYISCWRVSQTCSVRSWKCDFWAVGFSGGDSVNRVIFVRTPRPENNLWGAVLFLLPCGSRGFSPGHQTSWQVPLPAEPSHKHRH